MANPKEPTKQQSQDGKMQKGQHGGQDAGQGQRGQQQQGMEPGRGQSGDDKSKSQQSPQRR